MSPGERPPLLDTLLVPHMFVMEENRCLESKEDCIEIVMVLRYLTYGAWSYKPGPQP